jgi:1-deoxy-D-xylulose-5-phosphate synthase
VLLEEIQSPADLRSLGPADLIRLCAEIRQFLISAVAKTGGHLGPNLGVVELTVALHRTFDSPRDVIVWDTGHQAYVHKMLTGRTQLFDTLRQHGGLSGYPSRGESEHDVMENSHASTGLSYAAAIAKAKALRGDRSKVVCVVGDGALTGGMAYEALNNIAELRSEVIIILNDNGRSYAPTVGGIAHNLGQLRLSPRYEAAKGAAGNVLRGLPVFGDTAYGTARRMKNSLKQLVSTPSIFEALDLKYGGPIDGHDMAELDRALADAKQLSGPVVVHVVTQKGHGYAPAVEDEIDKFHGVSSFDPDSGTFANKPQTWTDEFGSALVEMAEQDDRIVAITAAMASSTGLLKFAELFPDRFFDVGIAEQHAVTFAAGLAMQGLRPVVCIYSTFLQRAFDQVLCDVALHKLGVTFVLDRAGVTGDDGPSHHGMFDIAYLRSVPGMVVSSPRTPQDLRRLLGMALSAPGPFAIRYPRGTLPTPSIATPYVAPYHCATLREGSDVLLVGLGKMAEFSLQAAELLAKQGVEATVVDAIYAKPIDTRIADLARRHRLVVCVEDGIRTGGLGSAVVELLADAGVAAATIRLGLPDAFLEHGNQTLLLAELGLDPEGIKKTVLQALGATPAKAPRANRHDVAANV